MKKLVLSLAAFAALTANGQTRLSLYEEFSGENCAPCAASNPGLWSLISANPTKVLLIKYQSPIPSAGPIYNLYKTVTNARMSYYNVPFAPYGRLDGTGLGTGTAAPTSPGHVANLLQADINTASAISAPFNITVTHSWYANGDSVQTNITVNCVSNFAPSGAQLKLRVGMIEHLVYATAPGTNGEKDFHNVVREMYPDAAGTAINNSWTSGQSQNFTIKGKVPYYVNKANQPTMVVWIQNETDKAIAQAAVSTPAPAVATDMGAASITAPAMSCASGSITPSVTLKNAGSSSLSAATIYYRIDNGSWSSQPWTGTLAAGATTNVTLPAITLPATAGAHTLTDSVVATGDMNSGNNTNTTPVTAISTTGATLPLTNNWENGVPANWFFYDADGTGQKWVNGNGTGLAHNKSSYMAWYKLSSYTAGSYSMIILPTPGGSGQRALDFYEAYAQKTASNNDKLEVVYSTDCGQNWTALWSQTGSGHATTTPKSAYWLPDTAAGSTDWAFRSIDLTNVPANSILAIKATADGGNNLFIDDMQMRTGAVSTGVATIAVVNALQLAPNPAKDMAKLSFDLKEAGKVQVAVYDAVGRMVSAVANQSMTAGKQQFDINTANLASGVYNIKISTENGSMTERLSVVK